jgi:hypothetical protein
MADQQLKQEQGYGGECACECMCTVVPEGKKLGDPVYGPGPRSERAT